MINYELNYRAELDFLSPKDILHSRPSLEKLSFMRKDVKIRIDPGLNMLSKIVFLNNNNLYSLQKSF